METKLTRFIYKYSLKEQIKVLLLTLTIFPMLYFSLELPKIIINDAISGDGEASFLGLQFAPINFLLLLCSLLLVTVLISGAFKMRINTFKGVIGERMVRRLRYQLVERVMRFPPAQFQRTSQGEIISTITSETEPLAGFIGDSLAQPLFQGGTMLTILTFMFVQDPILGLVSISMIPLQAYIIPKMQKKLNALKKSRVTVVRHFSGQIGEVVDGQRDIKLYGTQRFHLAQFSHTLGRLFTIRLDIFRQKFFMKFINNFLNQLPPILFYGVGGILVIQGNLSIGALVAALAAYKDLVSPWKELLVYYQQFQDSKVRYEYIHEQFNPDGIISLTEQNATNTADYSAGLAIQHLYIKNERGDLISQNINLRIPPGSHINIISDNEILLKKLAMNIVNLEPVANGSILIGTQKHTDLASQELSRNIAYIGPEPFLIEGSILQNINYGLRLIPPHIDLATLDPDALEALHESSASGNSTDGIDDVWTDFGLAGIDGWHNFSAWLKSLMSSIGARRTVFEFGLKDYIDPQQIEPTIRDKFSLTKEDLFTNLRGVQASALVERFDQEQYCRHLTVIENIAFGLLDTEHLQLSLQEISNDSAFTALLEEVGLYKTLRDIGQKLAYDIIHHLAEKDPSSQLHRQYQSYDADLILSQLTECIGRPDHLPSCEFLLGMALGLKVSVHGDTWIDQSLKAQLIQLRQKVRASPIAIFAKHIEPLSKKSMNKRLSLMENLLWGYEIAPNNYQNHQQLVDIVEQALIENQADALVLIMIALSQVGIRGERLPQVAKQNIQLMRALMKRPKVLIMHNALPTKSDLEFQQLLSGIKQLLPQTSILILSGKKRVGADWIEYYQMDINGLQKTTQQALT